jgi:hypothetical protein
MLYYSVFRLGSYLPSAVSIGRNWYRIYTTWGMNSGVITELGRYILTV